MVEAFGDQRQHLRLQPVQLVAGPLSIAEAIWVDIARNAHPREFAILADLNGKIEDGATASDPLTGVVPVLGFVLDETEKWLTQEAETEPTMEERINATQAESH